MVPIPTGLILAYESILFENSNDVIYNICFYTSLMTNLLTFPMTYIWLDLFEDSCKEIDKHFKSIRWDCVGNNGRYDADIEVASIDTDVASFTKEFENLTEAWSPMLFLSMIMESIIVTNTGFLIYKYTILPAEEYTEPIILSKLFLFLCLIFGSFYVTYVVCARAEDAHNNVKEVFSKIK